MDTREQEQRQLGRDGYVSWETPTQEQLRALAEDLLYLELLSERAAH